MMPHPKKIKKIIIIIKFDMPSAKNFKEIKKNLNRNFRKFNIVDIKRSLETDCNL